ncbi:MAG TPA: heparin lyase I family protein [Actinomycetospora sp.]|uniref:heparin lyase I family protein n=1 Tax=Actinomycetospora sp. TaxID=1872135 RepID=UPI002F3EBD31
MARHRSGSSRPGRAGPGAPPPEGTPRTGSWPAALDAPATGPRTSPGKHRHDPATTPLDLAAIARAAAAARDDGAVTGDTGGLLDNRAPSPPATGGVPASGPRPPATGVVPAPPVTGGLPLHAAPPVTGGTPLHAAPPARAVPAPTAPPATGGFPTEGPWRQRRPDPAGPPPGRRGSHRAPRDGRFVTPTRAAGALALFGALTGASVAAASTGPSFLADPASDTGELVRPDVAVAPAGLSQPAAHTATATPRTASAAPHTARSAPHTTPVPHDDGGKTLWSADFASDGLSNFKSTPWNDVGAKSPTLSGGVLDVVMPGGGKRSEVEPKFKALQEGDQYYFGFTVKLAPDFPVNTSSWQVITQFKNEGEGTPPLELKVQNGKFVVDGDGGAFSKVVGDATPGQWTHLVLGVKFSSSDGTVSAWKDGVQKVADYAPPSGTMYAGKDSYVKTGIYRDTGIGQAGKLSFGSWAIGTSVGSVSKDLPAGLD